MREVWSFRVRSGRSGCLREQFGSKCLFEVCELELVEQVKRYHTVVDGEEPGDDDDDVGVKQKVSRAHNNLI